MGYTWAPLMSRAIGDSHGSCPKCVSPSFTSSVVTSPSPQPPRLKRYREGGLEAVDPRSRRAVSKPRAVSDDVIIAILGLHEQLGTDGLDAGPVTLQPNLHQAGLPVLSPPPPSPSRPHRATNSSPATTSTLTETTGATNKKAPADGRGDL